MKTGVYYLESTNISGIDVNKENLQMLEKLREKTEIELPLVRIEEASDCDLLLVFVVYLLPVKAVFMLFVVEEAIVFVNDFP